MADAEAGTVLEAVFEQLSVNASPTWLQSENIAVLKRPIDPTNEDANIYSLGPPAANLSVHTLSEPDKKVSAEVVQLTPSSCIVLGPNCHDVKFEGTELKGGSVVCTGEGCTASFTNVTFNACTLLVRDGAHVTLQQPFFADMGASTAGLSIFAHGEGTSVSVYGGSINGGTQGAIVHAGARLEATNFSLTNTGVDGFGVLGKGSHLLLMACTVHDLSPCSEFQCCDNIFTSGVDVQGGSDAQVTECQFLNCGIGAFASGEGTRLVAEGCTFQGNDRGASASGAAEVVVRGCHSTKNSTVGYSAEDKATLLASYSSASCNATGFGANNVARVVLSKCTATKNMGSGVHCVQGSMLEAEGCTLNQNGDCGVVVSDASEAVVKGCHINDSGFLGFFAEDLGSKLTAKGCSANGCEQIGFYSYSEASAVLENCTASKNGDHGICASEGSTMHAEGCHLRHNGKFGVCCTGAAKVVLKDCYSTNNGESGFYAQEEGTVVVTDSFAKGGSNGVCSIGEGGRMEMQRVELDGVLMDCTLPTENSYKVEGNNGYCMRVNKCD